MTRTFRTPHRFTSTAKARALGTVSATTLVLTGLLGGASPAYAQTAQPQTAQAQTAQAAPVEEITVTATRIIRNGYDAPTPTTVLGADQIQAAAESNVFTYVNQLPSLAGSVSTQTGNGGSSGGTGGLSSLNLRGLGTNRTLVMLDGRRVVGASLTGIADVSQFPQGLISRVDVVTGGASSSWGSDAVAGVVNFVLDTKYTGLKIDVSGAVTTYGDDRQANVSITGGTGFANDRGHFLVSAEYADQDGVNSALARPWYQGWKVLQYPIAQTPAGMPEYLTEPHVGASQMAHGGLITAGPLRGVAFGPGGSPYNFQFGTPFYGTFLGDPLMSGGQWQTSDIGWVSNLDDALTRETLYLRLSYDITDNISAWAEANYGTVHSWYNCCAEFKSAALTIKADNAFLPPAIAAQMATLGLTSFQYGTSNQDLGPVMVNNRRTMNRFALGLDGHLSAFDSNWTWAANFGQGVNLISNKDPNESITSLYNLAIDAVRSPATGAIVCRSTLTNPGNGCVPLDVIGTGVASQAAINYIMGTPYLYTHQWQTTAGVNVNGEPFSDWAGPISVAFGGEYRKEGVRGINDCLSSSNCGNPILSAGNNYFSGNFRATNGSYNVKEGFLETVIPLAKDTPWAKEADFNGAVRATDYSTAGYVTTWKLGVTYTPIDDLKFRATRSRDIRAPNLNDLFLAAQTFTQTVVDDFAPYAGQTFTISRPTTGNINLAPEIANTTGLGIVAQPSFFPGFSASFDYYDIGINGAISTLANQQEMDLCFAGNKTLCNFIQFNALGQPTSLTVQAINLASQTTRGYDIESSYRLTLADLVADWAGTMAFRGLATHVITNKQNPGVAGVPVHELAGENSGATPRWHVLLTEAYDNDAVDLTLTERWISAGVINTQWIQCTSGCPAPTVNYPTVNNDQIAGAFYLDLGFSYKLTRRDNGGVETQLYFKVDNLTNKAPPPSPSNGSLAYIGPGVNPTLYDVLGRMFHLGIRLSM